MKIVWLAQALADRRSTYSSMEAENPITALAVDEEITARASQLAEHPKLGRSGRLHGTRELVVTRAPYLVIYRLRGGTIEILRVLHQRQQWP